VISSRDHKNHKKYVFRVHQYARVKDVFKSKEEVYELCADSEISMFLIDRKFLENIASNIRVNRIDSKLKIRSIEIKIHDTFSYCHLDVYFHEQFKDEFKIAHITEKFHLVDNLNVNVLIDIDIMSSEKCILDFKFKQMIFSFCENIEISITIVRTSQFVNRSLLVAEQIVVSSHISMTIFVKIREKLLSERDYVFNSKENFMLESEEEFFSHIMINKFVAMQIRNTSTHSFVILKNLNIDKMSDYQKNEYFLTSSKNKHLAIALKKLIISLNKKVINAQKTLRNMINFNKSDKNESVENFLSEKFKKNSHSNSSNNETMLINEIIVHDSKEIVFKIVSMIDKYLNV
jgi:hypothetical protein